MKLELKTENEKNSKSFEIRFSLINFKVSKIFDNLLIHICENH